MAEANALTKANSNLPAELLEELYKDSGAGFEDTTADDYAIPYLAIAQSNSPQLKKSRGEFIKGLEQGNLFDTVEGRVYESVDIVPIHRERFYVEWVPRDSGGGFVERHSPKTDILAQTHRNEQGRDILPNGNEIIDTVYLYCLIVGEDGINRPVVVSFARTSMKKYKNLMSRARNLRAEGSEGMVFTPPLYAHIWKLGTVNETSRDGNEYFNWEVLDGPFPVDSKLLDEARALRQAIASGSRTAAEPEEHSDGAAARADVHDADVF